MDFATILEVQGNQGEILDYHLEFCVDAPAPEDVTAFYAFVTYLGRRASRWVRGAPFIEERTGDEGGSVGVLPLDPPSDSLVKERANLVSVLALVQEIERFAAARRVVIRLFIGGVYCGAVRPSGADDLVSQGLIVPWRERVEQG